jgi:putative ABC transport system permease protein
MDYWCQGNSKKIMVNKSFILTLLKRQLLFHPWQAVISVTGIALGVAIVLSIDLTNASASRAFDLASESISSDVSHQVFADNGDVDEMLYYTLRRVHGYKHIYPVIEGTVQLGDERYTLTGIDPVSLFNMTRTQQGPVNRGNENGENNSNLLSLITEPGTSLVSRKLLAKSGARVSQNLQLTIRGMSKNIRIIGVMNDNDFSGDLLTDIGTAQELLDMHGKLSRIDLKLNDEDVETITSLVREPLYIIQAGAEGNALNQITRAFRTNLTALSLLALVIGAFLIFNSMMISILQRREQIATMRTLGLVKSELTSIILCEIALLATVGVILGTGIGISLSHVLIKLASRTLNDLYFIREIQSVHLGMMSFVKAIALGFIATLFSALLPLRDALAISPLMTRSRTFLEQQSVRIHRRLLLISLVFFIAGFAVISMTDTSIIAGFAGLFFIIVAFACFIPPVLMFILKFIQPVFSWANNYTGVLAGRGVQASLSRTQVAVVALSIAISATIGVSIMISSFRNSVDIWLDSFLKADIYISAVGRDQGREITDDAIERIDNHPDVQFVATSYWKRIWKDDLPTRLNIVGLDQQSFANYDFSEQTPEMIWNDFTRIPSVIISEPYAYRNKLSVGDSVSLPSMSGPVLFKILGVFTDYSSDQGIIVMHNEIYRSFWSDYQVRSLSVYLKNTSDIDVVRNALDSTVLQAHGLRSRANRNLRDLSMNIFDRTFAITEVLRILTIIIASVGILGALLAIQLERTREFAIMRTHGMTRFELSRLMLAESGLIGGISGLLAIPLGMIMAFVLIDVINVRSFGWTMQLILESRYLFSALGLGIVAGIIAGLYPAWRMGVITPALAMRYE